MHETLLGLERMRAPPLAGAHENFARRSLAQRRQVAHSPKRRGCRMETGRADCYAMPFLEDAEGDFAHLPQNAAAVAKLAWCIQPVAVYVITKR